MVSSCPPGGGAWSESAPRSGQVSGTGTASRSWWSTAGRTLDGLAIVGTGGFIAYTSMRANARFGHSRTPDPLAGEIYSHLSVAAEVIARLIPTAVRFTRKMATGGPPCGGG
jgi:hypothetical protein